MVFQTEVVKKSLRAVYSPFEINISKLCDSDRSKKILVELWDYRNASSDVFIGSATFCLDQVLEGEISKQLKVPFEQSKSSVSTPSRKKKKNLGNFIVDSISISSKPRFLDYIRSGTKLALVVAVDFTSSNGKIDDPTSLHSLTSEKMLNPYQKAIKAVGDILINYDYDKLVPVYGFGGKPKMPTLRSSEALHCFPLNGNPTEPDVYGVDGIMQAYNFSVTHCDLSGPTYFYPVISETMSMCRSILSFGEDAYVILLILTDGVIHDMELTKRAIVDSSKLPLSIIIVGIGNADFKDMEILDGDNGLWDSSGRKAERDLVQFVPFNKFKGDPDKLAECVLDELPNQLVNYMKLMSKRPGIVEDIHLVFEKNVKSDSKETKEKTFSLQNAPQNQNRGRSFFKPIISRPFSVSRVNSVNSFHLYDSDSRSRSDHDDHLSAPLQDFRPLTPYSNPKPIGIDDLTN